MSNSGNFKRFDVYKAHKNGAKYADKSMVSSAALQEPVTKRGPGCRDPDIGEAVYPKSEYKAIPLKRIPFYHHPATVFTLLPKGIR